MARRGLLAHPLFPAIGALWIATALVLGALLVPASLLERAAAAVHLDELVPAARPPLGLTARLLLAFVLALCGSPAGWLAAQRLRRGAIVVSEPVVTRPAEPVGAAEPVREPYVDDEEDLARLAAARPGPAQRRRGLTSETAEAPSILEISALPALEPLTAEAPMARPVEAPAPASPASAGPAGEAVGESAVRFRNIAELGGEAAARLCAAPLEALGVIQLVERFALALAARRSRDRSAPDHIPTEPALAAPFAEPRAAGESLAISDGGRPFDMPLTTEPTRSAIDPAAEVARWALPEPEGEGEDVDEETAPDPAATPAYSSLSEMRPMTRAPAPLADFVRVDDDGEAPLAEAGPQPVVVFPGQAVPTPLLSTRVPGSDAPIGPQDTEAALREALAALRRMSGAA